MNKENLEATFPSELQGKMLSPKEHVAEAASPSGPGPFDTRAQCSLAILFLPLGLSFPPVVPEPWCPALDAGAREWMSHPKL